jgi:alkanesulfonate monooxygenase SsuD/methylene tetrahydromethanopterin reductase-like flavin-dependent oxidoreductase (luciferase family)
VRLGVGVGWHKDEFRFMGYEFAGRGPRADVGRRARVSRGALVVRGTFAPLPEPQPELWVGGGSERAIRRARELGDVWHPSGSVGPGAVKRVKERPEGAHQPQSLALDLLRHLSRAAQIKR